MKTSLEITDSLFKKVKKVALKRGTSIRSLVEEGLLLILDLEKKRSSAQPKILTYGKDGFTQEYQEKGLHWETLRDEIYKGHGS